MAIDVQGSEVVKPYVEKAGCTYPVLVDRDNLTGAYFGIKFVPYAVALNPDLTIAAGPFRANIDDVGFRELCRGWVKQGRLPTEWETRLGTPLGSREVKALECLAEARRALAEGRTQDAAELLQRGYQLDPENWLIRKQMWVLEHPEKFYTEEKPDRAWQQQRISDEDARLK